MKEHAKLISEKYLDHKNDENLAKYLIDENKRVRTSKNDENIVTRVKLVQFINGARTKWHYHTEEQILIWERGEGFVEFKLRGDLIEQNENTSNILPISNKRNNIVIAPYTIHRHGALENEKDFVHLAINRGKSFWLKEDGTPIP